jgi:hypothetical protein
MERLTEWNESSHKNAYYPRCFKEPCYGSGCKIKDCPFETAVCERLSAYEDTGLTPKEVTAQGELFDYALKESKTLAEQLTLLKHIRELAEADKDGRVVLLPCRGYADIVLMRNGIAFKPDHWNIHLTAFAENQPTPSGRTVALFDLSEVQESMEGKKDG